MAVGPVILVENEWMDQALGAQQLEERLGTTVRVADDFAALNAALDCLAGDPSSARPVVVLDLGIPGVCCFETVQRARELHTGAAIVVWTAAKDPSFLAAALLDGAMAAIDKARPPGVLTTAIERAATGRYVCAPDQAQWFLDFLLYYDHYRDRLRQGGGAHVWTDTKVAAREPAPEWAELLNEIAEGEPLAADDRWFAELLDFVRSYWLAPHLRQTMVALAVHTSRSQAAEALGKPTRTFDGYCSRLAPLLMPARYRNPDRQRTPGLALSKWVITNHAGCALSAKDHNVGKAAAGA